MQATIIMVLMILWTAVCVIGIYRRWPVFESTWPPKSRLSRRFVIAWIAAWLAFCGLAALFVFLRN
jgi:hypothetical protein